MRQSPDKFKTLSDKSMTLSYSKAAELIGVSERTIRRHAQMNPKLAYGVQNGRNKEIRIEWLVNEFPDVETNKRDVEFSEKMKNDISYLKEIISEKDKQIRDKDYQINKLIEQEGQSKILLANLQQQYQNLLSEPISQSKSNEKKGFWKRVFRK